MKKRIWILWHQGWDKAPDVCKTCLASWEYHNPDWEIVTLDSVTAKDWVNIDSKLPGLITNYISYSDILRLFLLNTYGGVWVDATTFCNKPLDEWAPDGTFLFHRTGQLIASWFVKAEVGSYIIDKWYEAMLEYWQRRMQSGETWSLDKQWVHRLFKQCYKRDLEFAMQFDKMEKINCDIDPDSRGNGPHFFTPFSKYFYEPLDDETKAVIDSKRDPLYKLTYKQAEDWRKRKDRSLIHPGDESLVTGFAPSGQIEYLFSTIQ